MSLIPLQTISGQTILQGSGSTVVISGQPVTISGNVVAISGTVTIAGAVTVGTPAVTTSISGNYVSIISGSVAAFSGLIVATSVSGNVVSVSGSVTTITSVSGNTVLPQTPTFIKSADITRYSVASGGTALTAITCVAVTVRNCGVSGDVILVGSLSSPPYFGTSGQAYPAISGLGIWLRDGDAITLNTTSTGNIKVTANLSGTPVSFIAVG